MSGSVESDLPGEFLRNFAPTVLNGWLTGNPCSCLLIAATVL